ncbi:heme/hemin ABC transporter substrate-binding protein [Roseomonas sp. USHLN139]|uniref:heme/hemin ABC transporter substrate-binding protein n=1 Tax=Roseomonas sp. USHLN139 TaxID=3081298 RepID=UPI003B020413
MISRRSLLQATALLAAPGLARAAVPRRIVAIGPALVETVCALGLQAALVAVDNSSLFPPAVTRLPQVGYLRQLPTEGIVGLAPDLLLLSDQAGPVQAVEVLRASGLPVAVIADGAGPEAVSRKILAAARALDQDGTALAAAVAADWQAMDAAIAAAPRPRVLFLLSTGRGAPLVAGAGTHAQALIEAAGGSNPMAGFQGYRPLSAEAAAIAAPDVLLMMQHALGEAGGRAAVLESPALALTPAAAQGRLVAIDPGHLTFGPRAPLARRALFAELHPGLALPALPERAWYRG